MRVQDEEFQMNGAGFAGRPLCGLFVGLLAFSALDVGAEPPPEILLAPPGDLSHGFGNDLVSGFTLDASGNVVPAAYLRSWSESRQGYVLWVTDGTVAGTHPASAISTDVGRSCTGGRSEALRYARRPFPQIGSGEAEKRRRSLTACDRDVIGDVRDRQ